ncbi:TniB family NTP-binding protein [Pseudomonas sp. RW409]|uniref:TniB family NTP-binding protein n=1 Tax=Pseudomonas sp. RW409 TaxID=2202895 RepID=UPI000D72DCA8|nr:TniB family NTP-binding protein [Pseudomonas sp. RW409]PWY36410.1 transposase [Pseudomonas sp. RW409]
MIDSQHLSSCCRKLLSLSDDRRISEIQNDQVWIDYPRSEDVFRIVDNILAVPDRNQAPCLLVYGEGGTGKSSIVRKLHSFKRFSDKLVFVDLTVKADGLKLPELLDRALGIPNGFVRYSRSHPNYLPVELLHMIKLRKIKGIVLDELHDAFLVPRNEQQRNLSLIKGLSNAPYGISVLGFGTKSAHASLKSDGQFYRRFNMVELGDWSDSDDFRSFLLGIEGHIPLKRPSLLDSEEITGFLLERTGGRMDSVVRMIRSAACYAIRSGEEKITVDLMRKAYSNPWGY